ncbi:hypothetical protein TNCV_269531 [Trichonephila clavipes]|nr:hypothetical protein TNCV_269531 [Trichonephila clavipes]
MRRYVPFPGQELRKFHATCHLSERQTTRTRLEYIFFISSSLADAKLLLQLDFGPRRRRKTRKTPRSLGRPWQKETGWGKETQSVSEFGKMTFSRTGLGGTETKFQWGIFFDVETCSKNELLLCSDG